jgi:hypothetical protein
MMTMMKTVLVLVLVLVHDISTESFLTCYFSARSPERHPLGCM